MRIVLAVAVAVALQLTALEVHAVSGEKAPGCTITGRVVASESGAPVPGATVVVADESFRTMTDANGAFALRHLPAGPHLVRISHVGYLTEPRLIEFGKAGDTAEIEVRLAVLPATLKGITVSPGRFNIMGIEPISAQTLTRGQLQSLPQFGDDLYRAVKRLPGLGSNDFSARFTVRGGEHEEVLVSLDGMEIYEPFHLKDIDGGVVGVVDGSVIQGVDLMTGAYTANYGDRLSGVFGLKSKRATTGQRQLSLGLSFLNARASMEGTFSDGRGYWLASARRGYIDLVLRMAGANDDLKPTYYDTFGKVQYQLSAKHVLAAYILHAGDHLEVKGNDDDFGDTLLTSFDNSYGWLTLYSSPSPKLSATSILSFGRVYQHRRGQAYMGYWRSPELQVVSERGFDFVGLKSDWEYELTDDILLRFGGESRWLDAEYDYTSKYFRYSWSNADTAVVIQLDGIDTTRTALSPNGERIGSYVSTRFRLAEPLTAEIGGRYDHVSYTGDDLWSPRVNLVFQPRPNTFLRAGWGRFYQSQRIDGILVGDGETVFQPAERADHYMIGYEHQFETGINLRLEAYLKKYDDLRPQPRNSFDPIEAFPELANDRTVVYRNSTDSRGMELFLKRDRGDKWSWWASYAYAKVEDNIDYIRFFPENVEAYQNTELPSPRDQRHTAYADVIYRPNASWQFNVAFQFHTGWPYTAVYLANATDNDGNVFYWIQAGEQWGARHKSYRRLDFRINRHLRAWGGRITMYAELINALNWENIRGYDYGIISNGNGVFLSRDAELWFERMPSFGAYYELNL